MDTIITFLKKNIPWLFSGILTYLIGYLWGNIRKKKERLKPSKYSSRFLTYIFDKIENYQLFIFKDSVESKQHVTLNEEFYMTKLLAEEIKKESFDVDVIFAICPGGGMIAEWLSLSFLGSYEKPIHVISICLERYQSETRVTQETVKVNDSVKELLQKIKKDSKILLVSDVVRTGESLRASLKYIKQFFPEQNILPISLFSYTHARTKPSLFIKETENRIRFDWKE